MVFLVAPRILARQERSLAINRSRQKREDINPARALREGISRQAMVNR